MFGLGETNALDDLIFSALFSTYWQRQESFQQIMHFSSANGAYELCSSPLMSIDF